MEQINYTGLLDNWDVVKRLQDQSRFTVVLSKFITKFIAPYLLVIIFKGIRLRNCRAAEKITGVGWLVRCIWLPSLLTIVRAAAMQGRVVNIYDVGVDSVAIEFSDARGE